MKRICILQNSLNYGGTDTFVINLCKGLILDGYNVTVVLSLDKSKDTPRLKELQETGADIVWTCSLGSFLAKVKHLCELYIIFKNGNYDAFQTNIDLFNGANLLIAWLAKVPIRECHSHNSQQGRELREGKTLPVILYQKSMRWLCWKFSNRRGGCSSIAMDFLFGDKWKNDSNSKVIYNGIDFSKYCGEFDIESKMKSLSLMKRFNICTVGRISYQKNPLFIVDVLNELFKLRNDCDFIWVGSGDMELQVKERVEQYNIADRIHFLGNRTDVAEILSVSDLFFLPSFFEGLAIVLIEAQAAGLPCVVSENTAQESNCGALKYLPLSESALYWAEQLSCILDGNHSLCVDQNKLSKYSTDYMVNEMKDFLKYE